MSNHSQYMQTMDKYGLNEIKSKYISLVDRAEAAPVSAGFFGEGPTVLKVLGNILRLPELSSILFTGEFRLHISRADQQTFFQKNAQGNIPLSFSEFAEMLQGSDGLNDSDEMFEGGITVSGDLLDGLTLTAATLEKGVDPEALLYTDTSALCLSATHLLSMQERALIKRPEISNPHFFLSDHEKIREDERENVESIFYSFAFGPAYLVPSDDCDAKALFDIWKQPDCLSQLRQSKIDAYIAPMISAEIRQRLDAVIGERDLMEKTVLHLQEAKEELPKYRDKTTRYIFVNYVDGIKTNTHSELLRFYEKMEWDIKEGIEEEPDVKALQDALPNYIAGSWSEFVENILEPKIQRNIRSLEPAIEEYVNEKAELFLKELLTPEELDLVDVVIRDAVKRGNISNSITDVISGSAPMDKAENVTLRRMLPKCLMALGGIAVLSHSILPGALFLAAGWKGNQKINEELQEQLITEGKKINNQYLKEVQSSIERLTERIKNETSDTVEKCYAGILDSLIRLTQDYQENTKEIHDRITSIRADLDALQPA